MSLIGIVIVIAPQQARDGRLGQSYRPAPAGEEYTSSCQSTGPKIALRFESPDSQQTAKAPSLSHSLLLRCSIALFHPFFNAQTPKHHHLLSVPSQGFFFSLSLTVPCTARGRHRGAEEKEKNGRLCVFLCVWWRTWDGGKVDDWGVKRLVWECQQNHSSLLIFYWSLCSCFEYQPSLLTCSLWCLLLMRDVGDVPFLFLHRLFPPLLVTPANGKWIENNNTKMIKKHYVYIYIYIYIYIHIYAMFQFPHIKKNNAKFSWYGCNDAYQIFFIAFCAWQIFILGSVHRQAYGGWIMSIRLKVKQPSYHSHAHHSQGVTSPSAVRSHNTLLMKADGEAGDVGPWRPTWIR